MKKAPERVKFAVVYGRSFSRVVSSHVLEMYRLGLSPKPHLGTGRAVRTFRRPGQGERDE